MSRKKKIVTISFVRQDKKGKVKGCMKTVIYTIIPQPVFPPAIRVLSGKGGLRLLL
jgi:hypothetical protein